MTIAKSIVETLATVVSEDHFKKGDKVTVHNAKSYDALCKTDKVSGKVIGSMGKGDKEVYMVQVGTGQMNVSVKDLKIEEAASASTPIKMPEEVAAMKKRLGELLRELKAGLADAQSDDSPESKESAKIYKDQVKNTEESIKACTQLEYALLDLKKSLLV